MVKDRVLGIVQREEAAKLRRILDPFLLRETEDEGCLAAAVAIQ
jgi:hypothetical protein